MFFARHFKVFISFINNLPRKHFFALVLLSVLLLVIAFIPTPEKNSVPVKRQLTLPLVEKSGGKVHSAAKTLLSKPLIAQQVDTLNSNREVEIEIKAGDTLSAIFQKEGLSAALLQELLEVDKIYLRLGNLLPGQKIKLLISNEDQLLALKIKIDLANTLTFTLQDGTFTSHLETIKGIWRNKLFHGTVSGSFYVDAQQAGLSAGQIQQISAALQEKFDFNRQFRAGDKFRVLVAKQYIGGEYSYESEVLAVLLETRNKTYSAFLNEDGRYYDETGKGLGKAYRRSPVDGHPRISSGFNPKRLHPITKKVRPHNGTDFAVGIGTKVYAVGDGVVVRAGYHAAAGNYIVIKHGRKYTTRFLHLSKIYVRKGQRIKMGHLIGRSGNTGRSTGPHLHYEFHIYGKPVNAMRVNLPLSKEVPKKQKKVFNARRDLFLKEMGREQA